MYSVVKLVVHSKFLECNFTVAEVAVHMSTDVSTDLIKVLIDDSVIYSVNVIDDFVIR
jgi:disulfide oxidoreductase YuzD